MQNFITEVDILEVRKEGRFTKQKDAIQYLQTILKDCGELKEHILERNRKLINLAGKIGIELTGDLIDGKYKVVFKNDREEPTPLQSFILENFAIEYGLYVGEELERINYLVSQVDDLHTELISELPHYCEVDLLSMSDKKEPVEC